MKLHVNPLEESLERASQSSQLTMGGAEAPKYQTETHSTSHDIVDEIEDVLSGLKRRGLKRATLNPTPVSYPSQGLNSSSFLDEHSNRTDLPANQYLTQILEGGHPPGELKYV